LKQEFSVRTGARSAHVEMYRTGSWTGLWGRYYNCHYWLKVKLIEEIMAQEGTYLIKHTNNWKEYPNKHKKGMKRGSKQPPTCWHHDEDCCDNSLWQNLIQVFRH
jgi:hypothetical protein